MTRLAAHRGGDQLDITAGDGTPLIASLRSVSVDFTVTGSTFSPRLQATDGTVTWTDGNGTVLATGLAPDLTLGAGTHTVRMIPSVPAVVTSLNLGFDADDDAGRTGPGSGFNKTPEPVTAVEGLNLLTGLLQFMAARTPITGHVDFTGMSSLIYVECFESEISSVDVTGCGSLIRLCLEGCGLTALDVNPVRGTLQDLRAARQITGHLTFAPMQGPLPELWHYCVRDQQVTNLIQHAHLPAVVQHWAWNTGQTVSDTPTSPELNSYLSEENAYDTASVNRILTGLDALGATDGEANLFGSAAPSGAGVTARNNLIAKGWTVTAWA